MAHHLLLADDSVTIQRVVKLTFADEDVEVVTVGDGNQAVASIDRQPPDIVLADVAMPGRSGYEVAQHIRMSPHLAHIPVLLLTGAFEPVDEARASEVGCDGVLAKPFEPDVVVSRVKELLSRPRPVAPVRPLPQAPSVMFPLKESASSAVALEAPPAPAAVATTAPRQNPAAVDAYFERLDQAFANLALSPRTPPPVAAVEPPPATPSTLVDAFAGLAAQKAPATPAWDGATAAAPAANPAVSDAQIDQIVDRVIDKLTVRLGVNLADVVSTVAERIVRDEITEIKKRV